MGLLTKASVAIDGSKFKAVNTRDKNFTRGKVVDTKHHLIVTHEVTNDGSDRAQLANIACQAKQVLGVDEVEAVADRGYYSGAEILACQEAGIVVTLPKPMTSGIEAKGRFGKQDFRYVAEEDIYVCPAGGGDALPDEASAKGCHRDGATRTRLQPHPRDEHHGHSAADDRNEGIAKTNRRRMRRPDEGLILQPVRVFARPRPKADMDSSELLLCNLAAEPPFHRSQILAVIAQPSRSFEPLGRRFGDAIS